MDSNPDKKYFVINRKAIQIAIAIIYLIAELAMVTASIYKACQANWLPAIWFILATGLMRFYYTLQTKPPQ
jgi:hypothetical protein